MIALLEYILTALLEYKRAHVPSAQPTLKDESNLYYNKLLCCVISCLL